MKMKKLLALACAGCLCLSLAACGGGTKVYVQSVEALRNMGAIAPGDRFGGVVVSENVAEVQKDSDKAVKELLVKEGEDVKEGQELFSYDTDELQLALDKKKLELDQLKATITNYKSQITSLKNERAGLTGTAKLQYTIEIQSTEIDLKEAELNLGTKEAEVKRAEDLLANSTVVSPVEGRIQTISENGTDNYGNPLPYITIQQKGSYRVKGVLNELQRGGLTEGVRMTIFSRTNHQEVWSGTINLVDYENPYQGSDYDRYYGTSSDEMSSSSKYPFYVELDDTEGLILGQHVYMELETGEGDEDTLAISGAFVCYNEDGSAYVWAEKGGKLEKRAVTLGEYDYMQDKQEILEGLTEADYIAFPDGELCVEGAPTTHDLVVEETQAEGGVEE